MIHITMYLHGVQLEKDMEVKWSENPFEPSVNVNVHTPSPLKVPEYSAGQFPSHFTFNLLYPCFHCVTLVVSSECVEQQDPKNRKGVCEQPKGSTAERRKSGEQVDNKYRY